MHDFVVETGGNRAGRLRFRTLLEAHHHLDFGAKGFAVTFDGFFAVSVEEEVRLNGSVIVIFSHSYLFVRCFRQLFRFAFQIFAGLIPVFLRSIASIFILFSSSLLGLRVSLGFPTKFFQGQGR